MRRYRALTMVESLAIIVACLLLLAAVYRAFVVTRPYSTRSSCLSNLKQSSLGALMYANDYDDKLPTASKWMDQIVPYTKNEAIFHDVSIVKPGEYGYAFRDRLSGRSQTELKEPDKVILLFDSNLLGRNEHSELWSLPQKGRHKGDNEEFGSDMVAFEDGHARSLSASPTSTGLRLPEALQADDKAVDELAKVAASAKSLGKG